MKRIMAVLILGLGWTGTSYSVEPTWYGKLSFMNGSDESYIDESWIGFGVGADFLSLADDVQIGSEVGISFLGEGSMSGKTFSLFGNLTYWPIAHEQGGFYLTGGAGLVRASAKVDTAHWKYSSAESALGIHGKAGLQYGVPAAKLFMEFELTHAFHDIDEYDNEDPFYATGSGTTYNFGFGVRLRLSQ